MREKTAAAAVLAQFYSGVENILKRIARFHEFPLPAGEMWYIDLLPVLFDDSLANGVSAYRKFRPVVHHG